MEIAFFTRFLKLAPGTTLNKLAEEARRCGHKIHVIRPLDLRLREGREGGQVHYVGQRWRNIDLVIPLLRWDDHFAWILLDELENAGQRVVKTPRLPQGDRALMQSYFEKAGLMMPPTYILSRAQVWEQRKKLPWPMVIKARVSHGQRLVRLMNDWGMLDDLLYELDNVVEEPFYMFGKSALMGDYVSVLVVGDAILGPHVRKDGMMESSPQSKGAGVHTERLDSTVLSAQELAVVRTVRKMYGVLIASVDFVRTPEGPLLIEVNTAPSIAPYERAGSSHVVKDMVNMLELLTRRK